MKSSGEKIQIFGGATWGVDSITRLRSRCCRIRVGDTTFIIHDGKGRVEDRGQYIAIPQNRPDLGGDLDYLFALKSEPFFTKDEKEIKRMVINELDELCETLKSFGVEWTEEIDNLRPYRDGTSKFDVSKVVRVSVLTIGDFSEKKHGIIDNGHYISIPQNMGTEQNYLHALKSRPLFSCYEKDMIDDTK